MVSLSTIHRLLCAFHLSFDGPCVYILSPCANAERQQGRETVVLLLSCMHCAIASSHSVLILNSRLLPAFAISNNNTYSSSSIGGASDCAYSCLNDNVESYYG